MVALAALVVAALGQAAPDAAPASPPPCTASADCARANGYGSVCTFGACAGYMDDRDLLEMIGLKKSRGELVPMKLYPSIIPSVGYTPQNGVVVGITTLVGVYLGDPRTTTISNFGLVALYTSKQQVIFQSRATFLLPENAWQLQGDYRLLLTNQPTYGLGSSSSSGGTEASVGGGGDLTTLPGAQPMDFNLIRFHQAALRRVKGSFYAGGSVRFDRYYDIEDQSLDLAASPPQVTSHYAYSRQFGFNPAAYSATALAAELLYDSRDSTISAYRGWYLSGSLRAYPKWMGNDRDATLGQVEARTYLGLSDEVPRNVLAFWLLGSAVTSGRLPYMALPSIGWDMSNRTGRGYVQGRFRGDGEVYGEVEWRFRLTGNGFLGGTVFANASTFSRPAVDVQGYTQGKEALFDKVRPAGGVGLRFMMNREARNAVTLDFAAGQDSFGVYFGAGEVF
jgi:hypothetical protein